MGQPGFRGVGAGNLAARGSRSCLKDRLAWTEPTSSMTSRTEAPQARTHVECVVRSLVVPQVVQRREMRVVEVEDVDVVAMQVPSGVG